MLILGIYTNEGLTAVSGSVEHVNGEVRPGVVEIVGDDVFAALALALRDAEIVKARHATLYTNDPRLLHWLTPPIMIVPDKYTIVDGWGKVGYGGNPDQWAIFSRLFVCGNWKIKQVKRLPNTEALLDDYKAKDKTQPGDYADYHGSRASAAPGRDRDAVSGCQRRIYAGLWTSS